MSMDHEPQPAAASNAELAAGPGESRREVCCSMTSVLVRLVRSSGGEQSVAELLRKAGSEHEAAYLEDPDNWISQDEVTALLQAGAQITGDPAFGRKVGEETVNQHAGKQVATLLRSLGSVEAVLQAVAHTAGKLTTTMIVEALDVGPGHATVRAVAREGFSRGILNCDLTVGLLTTTPGLFGLPPARVHQSECQAHGGEQCLYTVTWDAEQAQAASDPQQRVTALEAQLLATSERLHSVYAIASDLVSTEDLQAVLHRIVDRAADAVRAPSHILAVRPGQGAELQVYSRGIAQDEAKELARATLAGEPTPGESLLAVDVSSSRRSYGKLIARYAGAIEFFPQERDILGLYAKHAAAVLDMAVALQDSDQRHEQVSSLLALSHALAAAGTTLEVAQRLAEATPEVVDCDRMAVWLWEEHERRLRFTSSWARSGENDSALSGRTISPEQTPNLQRMLAVPEPHFFEDGTEDEFIAAIMKMLDVVALTVVPIIARGEFLGILTASVTERPERLHRDDDLVQRLTGVAALAAPAIQNGQLVDQLRYKASHDGLTGLLNRVGFRTHIDAALDRVVPHDGHVGLLFVDLNEFKRVNDLYGHEAGDELIRQAAARLSSTCRGTDEVARLGGDEFAVVLAEVDRDEQVRAAERHVREAFLEPFELAAVTLSVGASVGGGLWPQDGATVTDLVRHADAAMYQDKARSRRAAA
jgi:diguanylate cyclase (GGDEF)-like protein